MNLTTQDMLAKNIRAEEEWVDMIPTVAFSHRCSQSASTGYSLLELITGHVPKLPVDVNMKYLAKSELCRDLTEEEVREIEDECLSWNVLEMKKVKEAIIGNAKVNILNAQIRQKRNYDKRYEQKDELDVGDLVLYEYQQKKRKGGKLNKRYSGPYEIKDISKSGNCLLEHLNGGTKKQKIPLAHLQRFHSRTLKVDSDNGNMDESEDESSVLFKRDESKEAEERDKSIGRLLNKFDTYKNMVIRKDENRIQQEDTNENSRIKDAMQKYLSQKSIAEKMGMKRVTTNRPQGTCVPSKQKKKVSFLDEITTRTYDVGDVFQVLKDPEGLAEDIKLDTDDSVEDGIFTTHEQEKSSRIRGITEFGISYTFTEDIERGRTTFTKDKKANAKDMVVLIDDKSEKAFTELETGRSNVFKENKEYVNSNKMPAPQLNNMFTGEKIHIVTTTNDDEMLHSEETRSRQRVQAAKERFKLKSHKRRLKEDISFGRNK